MYTYNLKYTIENVIKIQNKYIYGRDRSGIPLSTNSTQPYKHQW